MKKYSVVMVSGFLLVMAASGQSTNLVAGWDYTEAGALTHSNAAVIASDSSFDWNSNNSLNESLDGTWGSIFVPGQIPNTTDLTGSLGSTRIKEIIPIEFTITVADGYQLNLEGISWDYAAPFPTSPKTTSLKYVSGSLFVADGTEIYSIHTGGVGAFNIDVLEADLDATLPDQVLVAGESATFSINGSGNSGASFLDNVAIFGAVTPYVGPTNELLLGQTTFKIAATNVNATEFFDDVIVTNPLVSVTTTNSSDGAGANLINRNASSDGYYGPDGVAEYATGETTNLLSALTLNNSSTAYWQEWTIVNDSSENLQITQFLFDYMNMFQGKPDMVLTYQSGDLSDLDGTEAGRLTPSGENNTAGLLDYRDASFNISAVLVDSILAPGESATFRFSGTPGSGRCAADNIAFVGKFGVSAPQNLPPLFDAETYVGSDILINTSTTGTLAGAATDPEGAPITYSITEGPVWLTMETNGVYFGAPTSGDVGPNTFTVAASDGTLSSSATLIINVFDPVLNAFSMVGWDSGALGAPDKTKGTELSAGVTNLTTDNGSGTPTSIDQTWGSLFFEPLPAADGGKARKPRRGTIYTLSVTNTSLLSVELEGIHMDYGRLWNDAPKTIMIDYAGGSLSDPATNLYTVSLAPIGSFVDYDVVLSNTLSDVTLQPGDHAVFTLTFTNSPSANSAGFLDNLAVVYSTTVPEFIDTDFDGIDDYWEMKYFNSLTNANASSDYEPDGFIDLFEYKAGTDPTNALSGLFINNFVKDGVPNQFVITWQSVTGKTYRVVSTQNLQSGSWTPIVPGIAATPPENTESVSSEETETFFRIELEE